MVRKVWIFPRSSAGKEEILVRFLGWDDPLKDGMQTHSSILTWRISMNQGAWQAVVHGVTNSWTH